MSKEYLAGIVARECGLSPDRADEAVAAIFDVMKRALAEGDPKVQVNGFGQFVLKHKGPRMAFNPFARVPAPVSARTVVVFKPSKTVMQAVNTGKVETVLGGDRGRERKEYYGRKSLRPPWV